MKTSDEIYNLQDCSKCMNTRRISYEDPYLGVRDKQCSCVDYKKRVAILKKARIPKTYLGYELCDYKAEIGGEECWGANHESFRRLVKASHNHKTILHEAIDILIYGGVSCGKTMLATIILKNMILDYGYTGVFVTADELVTLAMEKTRFGVDNDFTLDSLTDVDFVVVDNFHRVVDLDDARVSGTIKIILNDFFQQRKHNGKSFILTSHGSLRSLLQKQRFVDNLAYTVVGFKFQGNCGADVRKRKEESLGL